MNFEESEKELDVADPAEVDKSSTDLEEGFSDSSSVEENENESEESSTDVLEEIPKQEQTIEERSRYARMRREKEEEEKKAKEAYQRGKVDFLKGKMNPYTQTVISDEKDVEVYENMYKLSEEGKDPIADYPLYIAEKQRQAEEERKKQEQMEEQARNDIETFSKKFPSINISDLLQDEQFMDYFEGKNKPLAEVYENYQKLINNFRTESMKQAEQAINNASATPGNLGGQAELIVDYSTMPRDAFLKEVERVTNGE